MRSTQERLRFVMEPHVAPGSGRPPGTCLPRFLGLAAAATRLTTRALFAADERPGWLDPQMPAAWQREHGRA